MAKRPTHKTSKPAVPKDDHGEEELLAILAGKEVENILVEQENLPAGEIPPIGAIPDAFVEPVVVRAAAPQTSVAAEASFPVEAVDNLIEKLVAEDAPAEAAPAIAVAPKETPVAEPAAAISAEPGQAPVAAAPQADSNPAGEISLDELDALLAKRAEAAKTAKFTTPPAAPAPKKEEIAADIRSSFPPPAQAPDRPERVAFIAEDGTVAKAAGISEKAAAEDQAVAAGVAAKPMGLQALQRLLALLDWPFRSLPAPVKRLCGVVAVVLLIPALTLLVLCLFFTPAPGH